MKLLLAVLAFAVGGLSQTVPIDKEWKKLDINGLLAALDRAQYPFLVRRLTMSTVDPKFAAIPGPGQENVLWDVEKTMAERQGRKPVNFVIWDSDFPKYCDQVAIGGYVYQVMVFPPLLLAVSFSSDGDIGIVHVYARVAEDSKIQINLFPERFRMAHIQPKLELQSPLPPSVIGKKIESRARWSAGFTRVLGALQTKQTTIQSYATANGVNNGSFRIRDQVTGRQWEGDYQGTSSASGSSSTTITMPDVEARARAEAHADAIQIQAADRAANISDAALRANTLTRGTDTFGAIYFRRDKKAKFSVLSIPIGTFQFEFGVNWQK